MFSLCCVERKSERIAKRISFSKFVNDERNPIDVDMEEESNRMSEGNVENVSATKNVLKGQRSPAAKKPRGEVPDDQGGSHGGGGASKRVMDVDDDFVNEKPTVVVGNQDLLVPKQEKFKRKPKQEKYDVPSIRTRSSPHSLCNAMKKLSKEQKECVEAMGFGKFLTMTVDGIPGNLGYYVVDNLDTTTMTLKLTEGGIKITKSGIHALTGLPNVGIVIAKSDDAKSVIIASKT
ncbi:uncharacterized protein LOC143624506 [Bidens hawaiensis]|uniref:uncharacterized protein LOC143624506 n=1 Tax=Bidens hawaiensis TaxID=980011 RepID=UPI00404A6A77